MNRRLISALALLSAALLTAGCSDKSPLVPEADQIVVRAYLYAGQPVTDIDITSALALDSEDSLAPPISDATVSLTRSGVSYTLTPTSGQSGYYHYAGADLSVAAGDQFSLSVSYGGRTATASTTVPAAPSGVTVYPTELTLTQNDFSEFGGPGSGGGGFGRFFADDTTALLVSWEREDGASYYVTLENLETDPEPINVTSSDRPAFNVRFISMPVTSGQYRVTRQSVSYFGRYMVRVYRVNQEYADLYLSRSQDSRDLNEPLTNISGGLGVFTAFNCDSVFINIIKGS